MRRVVVDLDGTLCRQVPDGPGGPDYGNATPILHRIAHVCRMFAAGDRIVIKTARGATTGQNWRHVTERQLARWGVPYHELYVAEMPPPEYDVWIDDKARDPREWDT